MPASPSASPDHIKDVNWRYHDAAAHTYDSKWGIDFGPVGQDQVEGKIVKALGSVPVEPFSDALEIGAGTGYFSLNLLQAGVIAKATATDISPGMLEALAGEREGAQARGPHGARRGRAAAVRGRELRSRLRPRRSPPHSRPRPRPSASSTGSCDPAAR